MTEMCENMIVNYVPDLSLWKCSCNYNIELNHAAFRRVICDMDDEAFSCRTKSMLDIKILFLGKSFEKFNYFIFGVVSRGPLHNRTLYHFCFLFFQLLWRQ